MNLGEHFSTKYFWAPPDTLVNHIKITSNPCELNFSLNLSCFVFRKFLSSVVRIYYKKKIFIEITPFKTFKRGISFIATQQYLLELISLISQFN